MKTKKCYHCKKILSLDCFCKDNRTKDRLKGTCKSCNTASFKRWYEKNKEYMRWYSKQWRKENRERHLNSLKIWHANNHERDNENVRRWCKNNPEKAIEIRRKTYQKNRDRRLQDAKDWQRKNIERCKENSKNYRMKFPLRKSANKAVDTAILEGRLRRLSWCQMCGKKNGSKNIEAHHGSYAKEDWLSVVWLCHMHHRRVHAWLNKNNIDKGG